jgi:hypothetical protein
MPDMKQNTCLDLAAERVIKNVTGRSLLPRKYSMAVLITSGRKDAAQHSGDFADVNLESTRGRQ